MAWWAPLVSVAAKAALKALAVADRQHVEKVRAEQAQTGAALQRGEDDRALVEELRRDLEIHMRPGGLGPALDRLDRIAGRLSDAEGDGPDDGRQ